MICTKFNDKLPEWLKSNINGDCPVCGAPIVDDGPPSEEYGVLPTQRWCLNTKCYGHMSRRVVKLADKFGIKGIGPAKAMEMCNMYSFETHMDAIQYWFPETLSVHLWEVADMAMIYGYSSKWKELLSGYKSFIDFYNNSPYVPAEFIENFEYLIKCESLFNIKPPLSSKTINVMITGSINGYNNRESFVSDMNDLVGHIIQVNDVKGSVTKADYLIKEEGSSDYTKSEKAMRHGVPIVTSNQFMRILRAVLEEYFAGTEKSSTKTTQ